MPKKFSMILAMTQNGGIGYNNQLPWKLKTDLQRFREITKGETVIMGRKTFESINCKPLQHRANFIISNTMKTARDYQVFPSVTRALEYLKTSNSKVYVIGGKQIFEEALGTNMCEKVHLTRVGVEVPCDVYLDKDVFKDFNVFKTSETFSEKGINFDYQCLLNPNVTQDRTYTYIKEQHEEYQYLNLIKKILEKGVEKDDRTGVGTKSIFGETMKFNLRHAFPLLTTKEVFFRGVVEELLWFIKGSTNGKELLEKGVKIWKDNGTRTYLDSIGLTDRNEHDLGPIYGFQWRHFGAEYKDCHSVYSNQGVDQLSNVIHQIKNTPDSRRIIMSAWNPCDLHKMALPPCHVMAQFYVANGELSCMMYQRSCDFGLGVPFNIASYALLTHLIARECELKVGDFIHVLGDTHIYKNHFAAMVEQIQRVPYPFPLLQINSTKSMFDLEAKHIQLVGYNCHKKLEMKMAI